MLTVNYEIEIEASTQKVFDLMLGKTNYEIWTTPFSEGSTYIGNWEKGSKMIFTNATDIKIENGMLSEIAENIPGKYISICHKGMLVDGLEILAGPQVDAWVNSTENYSYLPTDTGTKLIIEIDINQDYKDFFDESWPLALKKLKEICEK